VTGMKNLRLRLMEEEDLTAKVKWANNPEVNKYVVFDHKVTIEETKRWFRRQSENSDIKLFAIVLGDEPIGYMKLFKDTLNNNGELHIIIGEKQYWGKGYGKEAISEFLKYCFVEEKLNKVFLYVLTWNRTAFNLYKKCGFGVEGKLRKQLKHNDGKYYDAYFMGILNRGL
jgi:RimJ/RimL family protein N-acetyltransferase